MKGSVIKRGDRTYQLRLSLGYDETTGKRLYKHETVHCTLKEAHTRLRELIRQYEGGQMVVKEDRSSLNKLIEHWLNNHKDGEIGKGSYETYRRVWRYYIEKGIGKTPLHRLTAADIYDFYLALKGKSLTVVRLTTTVLKQSLDLAVQQRRLAANPMNGVKRPQRKREQKLKLVRSMNPQQVHLFLDAVSDEVYRMMFECAVISGMRPGEYLGLTWDFVDWERSEIVVERAVMYSEEDGPEWSLTKTEDGMRRIVMPVEFMDRLRAYRDGTQATMRKFAGQQWRERNLVFCDRQGRFRLIDTVRQYFRATLKRAELTGFRLYDLRHTMATLLLLQDENIKVVAERLGHSSPAITLKFYAHVLPSMQQRAATKLGGLLYQRVA